MKLLHLPIRSLLAVLATLTLIAGPATHAFAGVKPGKFFAGSSAFILINLTEESETNPHFYQLNLGYRVTESDTLSVEFITWHYHAPLGIPYGPKKNDPAERFPGYAKSTGIALAYQRFVWDQVYTAIHSAFFDQEFFDTADQKIGTGDQVFMTFRLGYHFSLFDDRFFVEPNLALTYWPVNTGLPESFRAKDRKWPNTFFPEPGLHFGFTF